MKKIILFILFSFYLITIIAAQEVKNNEILKSEFEAITINGVTIKEISNPDINYTKEKMQQLFGTPNSFKEVDNLYTLNYGGNVVAGSAYRNSNGQVSNVEIIESTWKISIKGFEFTVGETIAGFEAYFGSEFKVFTSQYSDNPFTGFNYTLNDFNDIVIDFNKITKKVISIEYYKLP